LRLCAFALTLFLIAACDAFSSTPTPTDIAPTVISKFIATVHISPTPNDAEQQATQFAQRSTPTAIPITLTPSPTIYIGVFLGEAEELDDGPIPTPALLQRPTDETPTFNEVLATCPREPDEMFGTLWLTDENATETIGCPASDVIEYAGSTQIFERGVMYFNPDGVVYVVSAESGQFWIVNQIPAVEADEISAPEGLRVPTFGFGAVWRSVPGIRETLGFARTDEQTTTFAVQPMQGGILLLDDNAGQVFVLMGNSANGTVYGPF
jgi:hypothetical protein